MLISKVKRISKIQSSFLQRHLCTKAKADKEKKNVYSHTVNLPSTQFPLWVKPQDRAKLDEKIHRECGFSELYSWQREALNGKPEFILHDGPPYANGTPHIGHAVNKILKDITLRSNLLQGKRVHYVPGWDCHGLPIELKAITSKDKLLSPLDIRKKAKNFALETINTQKAEFESWGVLADWEHNCYHTFDKEYVKNQLCQFYNLYKQDYIYRDLKPVYWSPSSRTALAESELEYKPDHVSKSIYLKIKLNQVPAHLLEGATDLHALIWTTTPWSLPANQFIAFNPALEYSVASVKGANVIVAKCLVESLKWTFQTDIEVVCDFPGQYLQDITYIHPINKEQRDLKLLPAGFVSSSKGTGLVHCAPAHGQDDFLLALAEKIPVLNLITNQGKYSPDAGPGLEGLNILGDGKDQVLHLVEPDVLWTENYQHSYPYDWRTKKPVILKASQQWFIDTERIKPEALACLEEVNFVPESAKKTLRDQIAQRPYWCISRQRVWGVPIPVFYDGDTIIVNEANIKHFCTLIDEHGPDFWWSLSVEQLLNTSDVNSNVTKSNDILDIWFDSGISWSHVLKDKPAHVYMEGMDQINGWFMSSLLTSVALKHTAPFRNVFLHGFVVDEKGAKMSKSVGNVISAHDITQGAKKLPAYGVDVLRWWVAAHASKDPTVPIGKNILNSSQDDVQKIRSSLRYLLGVLHNHSESTGSISRYVDVYMLKRLCEFQNTMDTLYGEFQYARASRVLLNFVVNELSAFYFTLVKDRLYCDSINGEARLSGLHTLHNIFHVLLRTVAPIMPHLAEEVYSHLPSRQDIHFFQTSKPDISQYKANDTSSVEAALLIRDEVNSNIPDNINRWKLHVSIQASNEIHSLLQPLLEPHSLFSLDSELCEILQVSTVDLVKSDTLPSNGFQSQVAPGSGSQCPRCRRFTSFNHPQQELCTRCYTVLNTVS
ncbi:isoleucine--tRNA ligase, mitochondrial isoform X3 [Diaphorina citri]|uniref:isoleucine--tRNA ligase n=1 Tax=Diaphorina citri TaxID=121845 RepID=A0A3Q0J7G6_DIACI|nr:isoleucine--tRNA ligase, mitochondrial isoform X1 [Diaphorina citri]XP_026682651.1 isoleucine--tRNA ligase, mitochondrial isoform X2 [Diaphorina citri]XP_026682652.1 isoleucine--tRNA ligase, mitochondrial isoform X3 [Diaphorina citri]